LTTFMILSNTVFIACATQYARDNLKVGSTPLINGIELFYHAYYVGELVLKLVVYQGVFFTGPDVRWNLFDLCLALTAFYDAYTILLGADGLNMTFLRVLRLVRMFKVLRVVRVMKHFRELRVMIVEIMGSITTLFWCLCTLAAVLFLCSLVFVQAVTGYLNGLDDSELNSDDAIVVASHEHWGTLLKAGDTMFKAITGGNDWDALASPIEAAGAHYYVLFVLSIAFLQLAVLNILTGMFCASAVEASESDRDDVTKQAAKLGALYKEDALRLFADIDDDKDGKISWKEFAEHAEHPNVKAYFGALDIEVRDAAHFFELLEAGSLDGEVDGKMFLEGCLRLKGNAKMVDIQGMRCQLTSLSRQVRGIAGFLGSGPCRSQAGEASFRPSPPSPGSESNAR